jgi:hypothetical protein
MPTGLDQSWGFADPAAAKTAGVKVISEYLSWDTSKNITASDVKAYHKVGIAMMLNWESQAGAPLKGAAQGKADATEAVRLAKALFSAVGYRPKNRTVVYFSCDTDVNSTQYPAIEAYYKAAKAVCAAAGFGVGAYGEAALVTHLHKAGITAAEWQTYAWSGGVLSPDADFYQYSNGQTLGGASVDFDRVIHAADLGAWWPPTNPLNIAPTTTQESAVTYTPTQYATAVWNHEFTLADGTKRTAGDLFLASRLRGIRTEHKLDSVVTAVNASLTRIASLQHAVAALPGGVVAKIKALVWGVK